MEKLDKARADVIEALTNALELCFSARQEGILTIHQEVKNILKTIPLFTYINYDLDDFILKAALLGDEQLIELLISQEDPFNFSGVYQAVMESTEVTNKVKDFVKEKYIEFRWLNGNPLSWL